MPEKFDIYAILGVLIPGVLIVCAFPLACPAVAHATADIKLPDGFAVIALISVSIFVGYLVQALASLVEPVLNYTWGGRASERALGCGLGDRYFSKADGARIRAKLVPLATAGASDQSLFCVAMQIAENFGSTRVSQFNALYAYHRALILLTIISLGLFAWSFWGGLASRLTTGQDIAIIVVLLLLLALFWHRGRQRGIYYVREVLFCAERQLAKLNPEGGKE